MRIFAGQRYYFWVRQNPAANDDQTRYMVEAYREEARELGTVMERMKMEMAQLRRELEDLKQGKHPTHVVVPRCDFECVRCHDWEDEL